VERSGGKWNQSVNWVSKNEAIRGVNRFVDMYRKCSMLWDSCSILWDIMIFIVTTFFVTVKILTLHYVLCVLVIILSFLMIVK